MINFAAVLVLLSQAVPANATAQNNWNWENIENDREGSPKGEILIYGKLATPVGQFHQHVEMGGGGGLAGLLFLGSSENFAVRLDGSLVVYGSETVRTPLSPTVPFIDVEVRTTNFIASAGFGPQVYLAAGTVRPYVFGTVGFAYFATESSASGTSNIESFASTTNFDDFSLALAGGGGVSVQLSDGGTPVALDLSAVYRHNGLTEYLTKGDLRAKRGGGYTVDPVRSETNMMTYQLGVSFLLW